MFVKYVERRAEVTIFEDILRQITLKESQYLATVAIKLLVQDDH